MLSGEAQAQDQHHRHLLQDEIENFTSVDSEEQEAGARPLSADELSPRSSAPQEPPDGGFVDPRAWAEERLTPVMGIAEVDALEARRTSKDLPPMAPAAPPTRRSGVVRVPTPLPAPRRDGARGRRRPDARAGVAGVGAGADTGPAARARAGTARDAATARGSAWQGKGGQELPNRCGDRDCHPGRGGRGGDRQKADNDAHPAAAAARGDDAHAVRVERAFERYRQAVVAHQWRRTDASRARRAPGGQRRRASRRGRRRQDAGRRHAGRRG